MSYDVVLTFRDNVVHRLKLGDDIQDAYAVIEQLGNTKDTFKFRNKQSELIYVANLNNYLFAFIEESKS
jgi:hypothetical protein